METNVVRPFKFVINHSNHRDNGSQLCCAWRPILKRLWEITTQVTLIRRDLFPAVEEIDAMTAAEEMMYRDYKNECDLDFEFLSVEEQDDDPN